MDVETESQRGEVTQNREHTHMFTLQVTVLGFNLALAESKAFTFNSRKGDNWDEFNSINMGNCSKKMKTPQGKIKALRNQHLLALSPS